MEALVVVEEVLVWTNETSVGEEGKGSEWNQGARWAPIQATTWRGVDLFSFFLINQGRALSSQKCLETEE